MSNDTDINLCGPFKVTDSSGRSLDVKAIRIFDEGYGMLDVYVDFGTPIEAGQYKDKTLIAGVMAQLRSMGYKGPDFGPSEPGLQERKLLVLEASDEFLPFAKSRGWKDLAEEFGE